MLVEDRFGATVAALVRGTEVVADAVEADAEVRLALVAGFAPAGLAREGPFPAALVAMSGRGHRAPPLNPRPGPVGQAVVRGVWLKVGDLPGRVCASTEHRGGGKKKKIGRAHV